jgi:hypothetical protein
LSSFNGADFEHELVVALVGAVLPVTARLHLQSHLVAHLAGRDGLHRRAEIGHVQALAELGRQGGLEELDHQGLALLLDVDAHLRVGQTDHHPTRAVGAAPEVDLAQPGHLGVLAGRKVDRLRSPCRHGGAGGLRALEDDEQRVALQLGAVIGGLTQVQHQAGTVARLGDGRRSHIALVDFDGVAPDGVADRARQVERDARRTLDRETLGNFLQRFAEFHAQHLHARLLGSLDATNHVRLLRPTHRGQAACDDRNHGPSASFHKVLLQMPCFHRAASCNCNVVTFSTMSPDGSWSSSRSVNSVSSTFNTRPKF